MAEQRKTLAWEAAVDGPSESSPRVFRLYNIYIELRGLLFRRVIFEIDTIGGQHKAVSLSFLEGRTSILVRLRQL